MTEQKLPPTMKKLKAIDLCCGAGGWACAARGLPIEFVAVVDREPLYLETWNENHGADHPTVNILCGDLLNRVTVDVLREKISCTPIDLIVGGIPCEQLSCARGANKASADELDGLHKLLDAIFGLVKHIGPRWWALEDVIQIERWLPTELEFGRRVPCRRIQAAEFGPQRRLRTFVGEFPEPPPTAGRVETIESCLLPGPFATESNWRSYEQRGGTGRDTSRVGTDKMRVIDRAQKSPTIMKKTEKGSRQRRSFMVEGPRGSVRRLSWQEQARVQGFPEDFLFIGAISRITDQIGQAIDIRVGRAILEAICLEAGLITRPSSQPTSSSTPAEPEGCWPVVGQSRSIARLSIEGLYTRFAKLGIARGRIDRHLIERGLPVPTRDREAQELRHLLFQMEKRGKSWAELTASPYGLT